MLFVYVLWTTLTRQIPFVFANPVQDITPLGDDPERLALGEMAAQMWTSFVVHLDPNRHAGMLISFLVMVCWMRC